MRARNVAFPAQLVIGAAPTCLRYGAGFQLRCTITTSRSASARSCSVGRLTSRARSAPLTPTCDLPPPTRSCSPRSLGSPDGRGGRRRFGAGAGLGAVGWGCAGGSVWAVGCGGPCRDEDRRRRRAVEPPWDSLTRRSCRSSVRPAASTGLSGPRPAGDRVLRRAPAGGGSAEREDLDQGARRLTAVLERDGQRPRDVEVVEQCSRQRGNAGVATGLRGGGIEVLE